MKLLAISISIGLTGCIERLRGDITSGQTNETPSDSEAKEQSLAAEEQYIFEKLQNAPCVVKGAPGGMTGEKEATIINRTNKGTHVKVVYPYHYSTDSLEVDAESEAVYIVNRDEVKRVQGDNIVNC